MQIGGMLSLASLSVLTTILGNVLNYNAIGSYTDAPVYWGASVPVWCWTAAFVVSLIFSNFLYFHVFSHLIGPHSNVRLLHHLSGLTQLKYFALVGLFCFFVSFNMLSLSIVGNSWGSILISTDIPTATMMMDRSPLGETNLLNTLPEVQDGITPSHSSSGDMLISLCVSLVLAIGIGALFIAAGGAIEPTIPAPNCL